MTRSQRFTFWFCVFSPMAILVYDAIIWDIGGIEATISGLFRELAQKHFWFPIFVGVLMCGLFLHWFGEYYLSLFFGED